MRLYVRFMMGNAVQRYNGLARLLHWGMALLIFGLLIAGFLMTAMPVSPVKFQVYGVHKSLGMLVLGLAVVRLIWWFMVAHPSPLPSHAIWERFLSKTIHVVLYLSFFVMPLSGWAMSSAGDYSIRFFGVFDVPAITPKNEVIFEVSKAVHLSSALLLVGAIGLHVAGALKHYLLDRDETVRRMGGNSVFMVIGVLLLGFAILLAGREVWVMALKVFGRESHDSVQVSEALRADSAIVMPETPLVQDAVQEWVIDPQASMLEIAFTQYGQLVESRFEDWSGRIVFDPARLSESAVHVQIDVASLKTGSADRDEQARGSEWFDVQTYPQAVFKSESFRVIGANRYQVDGVLALRGVELPVSFPFSLQISEGVQGGRRADMEAELALQRLDFGVGQGQWKATDAIGNSVNVRIKILAQAPAL